MPAWWWDYYHSDSSDFSMSLLFFLLVFGTCFGFVWAYQQQWGERHLVDSGRDASLPVIRYRLVRVGTHAEPDHHHESDA